MNSLAKPVRLYAEPQLENPYMVAAWPGIGNVGLISATYLKDKLEAIEFGEIEPRHFFYPQRVLIKDGVMEGMEFPGSKFFYKKGEKDLLIFLGDTQPTGEEELYQIANHVLDVGQHFGAKRIYTAGAAVAAIHHAMKSRVWAVPNSPKLISELRQMDVVLMSQIEDRRGQGSITGLNGLLLGVARRRGLEGVCFLGEIPMYIASFPVPYPKASRSVLEVLTKSLGVQIDTAELDYFARRMESEIDKLYMSLPMGVKEQLEKFRPVSPADTGQPGPITEDDKKSILKDVEEFFRKGKDTQA